MSAQVTQAAPGVTTIWAIAAHYKLWFDGSASEGGNGHLACGFVVEAPDGAKHRAPFTFGTGTNNVAEYAALLAGLRYLLETITIKPAWLKVYGDSMLVINQVWGGWKVKAPHLRPLQAEARSLLGKLAAAGVHCTGEWIRRDMNTEADGLCREAMKCATSAVPYAANEAAV